MIYDPQRRGDQFIGHGSINSYLIGLGDTTGLSDTHDLISGQSGTPPFTVAKVLNVTPAGTYSIATAYRRTADCPSRRRKSKRHHHRQHQRDGCDRWRLNTVTLNDSGNDRVVTGSGRNTITGGSGTDSIYGGAGANSLTAGTGSHQLLSASGNHSTLIGGAGASDTLTASGAEESLQAGSGNDQKLIVGSGISNTLVGGAGTSDTLYGRCGRGQFQLQAGTGDTQSLSATGSHAIRSLAAAERAISSPRLWVLTIRCKQEAEAVNRYLLQVTTANADRWCRNFRHSLCQHRQR